MAVDVAACIRDLEVARLVIRQADVDRQEVVPFEQLVEVRDHAARVGMGLENRAGLIRVERVGFARKRIRLGGGGTGWGQIQRAARGGSRQGLSGHALAFDLVVAPAEGGHDGVVP